MIQVSQLSDGSFDVSWDPNDPKEQHLNDLTKQDFIDLIQTKLETLVPKEPDPWLYMMSSNCETGGGSTVCIMMTQALPSCADDIMFTTQEERAIRKFREKFGDYYAGALVFLTRSQFFVVHGNYIPRVLHEIKADRCSIEFHMKLYCNYA
jgi:hypothetical protein